MLYQGLHAEYAPRARSDDQPIVDGLLLDNGEIWVVVARNEEDLDGWLDDGLPLKLCRAVLDDDTLLLGESDPDRDSLLSDVARGNRCER